MCKIMSQLGIAIDGGKDSLSMAARVGSETVKAPGNYLKYFMSIIKPIKTNLVINNGQHVSQFA